MARFARYSREAPMRNFAFIALVVLVLVAGLLAATAAPSAVAQSGGGYDLTWSTVDGGGGSSSGGRYSLDGTVGQADAGEQAGGGYSLGGGFWARLATALNLYLPLIQR
jgi:hypothetical protein